MKNSNANLFRREAHAHTAMLWATMPRTSREDADDAAALTATVADILADNALVAVTAQGLRLVKAVR